MKLETFENSTMFVVLGMILLMVTLHIAGCESKSDANSDSSESSSTNNSSDTGQVKTENDSSEQQNRTIGDRKTLNPEIVAERLLEDISDADLESNAAKLQDAFKSLNDIHIEANKTRISMLSAKLNSDDESRNNTTKEVNKNSN